MCDAEQIWPQLSLYEDQRLRTSTVKKSLNTPVSVIWYVAVIDSVSEPSAQPRADPVGVVVVTRICDRSALSSNVFMRFSAAMTSPAETVCIQIEPCRMCDGTNPKRSLMRDL